MSIAERLENLRREYSRLIDDISMARQDAARPQDRANYRHIGKRLEDMEHRFNHVIDDALGRLLP